jgi:hypothetical protein
MSYKRKYFALPLIPKTHSENHDLIVWFTYRRQGKNFREACKPMYEEYDKYQIYRKPTESEIINDWLKPNTPGVMLGFEGIIKIEDNSRLPYRTNY